jgi:hypothetical protein
MAMSAVGSAVPAVVTPEVREQQRLAGFPEVTRVR